MKLISLFVGTFYLLSLATLPLLAQDLSINKAINKAIDKTDKKNIISSAPSTNIQPLLQTENSQTNNNQIDKKQIILNQYATPIYDRYFDNSGRDLNSLIDDALQTNKELLAARQQIAIVQGRLKQAGLRPNPTLETEFATDKLITRAGEYEYTLTYTQPLELNGKRGQRVRVAQLELARTEQDVNFQEKQLIAAIKSQYLNVIAAGATLKFNEQLLALNQEILRTTNTRFKEGDVAKLDLNLVQVEVSRLRAQQLQTEAALRNALTQLQSQVGINIDRPIKLMSNLPQNIYEQLNIDTIQTKALQQRNDLLVARLDEEAAEAQIKLNQVEAKPDINLLAEFRQEKTTIEEGGFNDTNRKIGFGVSITLPIFNRNQGKIDEASALRIQARHRRELIEQIIKRDVALAYQNYQSTHDTITIFEQEILPSAQDNLNIIRTAYELGDRQLLDLIAEQRRLIEIQQQYIEALKNFSLARIELARASGDAIK